MWPGQQRTINYWDRAEAGPGPSAGVYTALVCLGPANPCQMLMELHHFSAEVASLVAGVGGEGWEGVG